MKCIPERELTKVLGLCALLPLVLIFLTHLSFTVTDIRAGGYLLPFTCINSTYTSTGRALTNLTDWENTTCVNVKQNHNDWLQAVFQFPNSSSNPDISVEVVVRNAKDCSSVNWNWFVESACVPKSFHECQTSTVGQQLHYSRCVVSCHCNPTCDYLHLKYTPVMYGDQSGEHLCDVYLVNPYEPVIPEARGILAISSATRQR